MSVAEKLMAKKQMARAEQRSSNMCWGKNCEGLFIPRGVGLKLADGRVWGNVCFRLVCWKCGRPKRFVTEDGKKKDVIYFDGGNGVSFDPMNFWVPREAVQKAVFDRSGAPVIGADGKQVMQFCPELKREFIRKILSLVDRNSPLEQYFTLTEVMMVK